MTEPKRAHAVTVSRTKRMTKRTKRTKRTTRRQKRGGKTRDGRDDAYRAVPEARQEPVPLVLSVLSDVRKRDRERLAPCGRASLIRSHRRRRRPDTFALHSRRIQQVKALLTSDVPCARPGQPPDTASLRDVSLSSGSFLLPFFIFSLLPNNERSANGETGNGITKTHRCAQFT